MKVKSLAKIFFIAFAFFFQLDLSAQWILQNSFGNNDALYDVHFLDTNNGYAVGNIFNSPGFNGMAIKTTDGGNNWNILNIGSTPTLRSVYFTSNQIGYAVGDSGTIIETTNGGVNWMPLTSGTTGNLESVFFVSPTIGFACGENVFLKTINSGSTWLITPLGGNYTSMHFTSADTGSMTAFIPNPSIGPPLNSFVVKTTDGGLNWSTKYIISNKMLSKINFQTSNVGYAVGYDLQLKTIDGGNHGIL